MEHNRKFKITSTADGDTTVSFADGTLKSRDGKYLLSFTVLADNDVSLKTDILLTSSRAVISRTEPNKTTLMIEMGKTLIGEYGLVFASVPVRVTGRNLIYDLCGGCGFAELEYDLLDLADKALCLKIRIDIE